MIKKNKKKKAKKVKGIQKRKKKKKVARKKHRPKSKRVVRRKKKPVRGAKAKKSKIVTQEKMAELIKKGENRGFITYSEILNTFPDIEKDMAGLDALYEELEKRGIEAKESREFLELK